MKTFKKFKIHLVNGAVYESSHKDRITLTGITNLFKLHLQNNDMLIGFDDPSVAIPYHAVCLIEGVDDEGEE